MPRSLRKYFAVIRAQFVNLRQFSANFFASLLTLPVALMILLYVYRSIAPGGEGLGPYSIVQLSLYFVGVTITWQVIQPAATVMWQSWQDINTGELAIYLSRPIDYVGLRYVRELASALIAMGLAAAVLVAVQLSQGAFQPLQVLQYVVSLWLAYSILFMWWFLAGALSFWWERPFTFRDLSWNVITLFSGGLIPIDLLSPALRTASEWLPFRGIYYVPASLFAGTLTGQAAWMQISVQAVWLVGLAVLARLVWSLGVRTYDGRGG